MIHPALIGEAQALHERFVAAQPFKHLCIDGFFEPAHAEAALAEFPVFDPVYATNEFGEVGRKAVRTSLKDIGPFYRRLHEYLASPDFLGFISRVTGIPDLRPDPEYFGGGTHENLDGQDLDPHIDFNFDPRLKMHRRLNLLVYLNKEWDPAWGGCIDLHSNPRRPQEDKVTGFAPLFNRAVMFETNEVSWHGFQMIRLPADKAHLSRKCISIYLYTLERPPHEVVPSHGTFYVQRPLPAHWVEGFRLSAQDVSDVRGLLHRRDAWLTQYDRREVVRGAAPAVSPDAEGADLLQVMEPRGQHADGWVGEHYTASIRPRERLSHLVVDGWVPEQWADGLVLEFSLQGRVVDGVTLEPGLFTHVLPLAAGAHEERLLSLRSARQFSPADTGSGDTRRLSFILRGLRGVSDRTVRLPLSAHIRSGHVLTGQDLQLLRDTFARRDARLEAYHHSEVAPGAR